MRTHIPCRRCGRLACACTQGPTIAGLALALLLLAAPLSAQVPDRFVIEPAQVTLGDNIIKLDSINLTVTMPATDSVAAAVQQQFHQAVISYLETCGCMESGPSPVNQIATGGIVLALGLIAWQLKGIKDKTGVEDAPLDPEPDADHPDDGYGESG